MDIQQIKKEIGERLRRARKEKGYSQEEMARLLGLTQVGYSAFERGRTLISLEHLLQLPRILSKPITYFLPAWAVSEEELQDMALDPLLQEVLQAWPELGQEGREIIRTTARALRQTKAGRPALRLVAEEKPEYNNELGNTTKGKEDSEGGEL